MSDVVDLRAERDRRSGPDVEHRTTDQWGRPMFNFAVDFEHGGSEWSVYLWAYDFEDAQSRVDALRATATLAGQIYEGGSL